MAISQVSIIPYPIDVPFNSASDINVAMEVEGVALWVEGNTKNYTAVSVHQTMINLTLVGQLIQLAYAGSIGFKCSTSILDILASYQSLLKNSVEATGGFVGACVSALKVHKAALQLIGKGNIEAAIKLLATCAKMAEGMAAASQRLVEEAETLCQYSKTALLSASEDVNITTERKKSIEKSINDLKAKEASLKQMKIDLEANIQEEKEAEEKFLKEAKEARMMAFGVAVISAIMAPIAQMGGMAAKGAASAAASSGHPTGAIAGGAILSALEEKEKQAREKTEAAQKELDQSKRKLEEAEEELASAKEEDKPKVNEKISTLKAQIESQTQALNKQDSALATAVEDLNKETERSRNQADQAAARRFELQKQQRVANAELAESLTRLSSAKVEEDNLATSIDSLEVTVQTLGKVVTTFANTRLFWLTVKARCDKLTNIEIIHTFAEVEMTDELADEVKSNGLNWLTLGQINQIASSAMNSIDEGVDAIMNKLPNKKTAIQLVKDGSIAMLKQLEEENSEK